MSFDMNDLVSNHPIKEEIRILKVERKEDEVAELKRILVSKAQKLLETHVGYDLIPWSGKVVVFDNEIAVKHAFYGLNEHRILGAPVWDSKLQCFTGMVTVTDFIHILCHFHEETSTAQTVADALSRQTIKDWSDIQMKRGTSIGKLLYIYPDEPLVSAVKIMSQHRIHRMCVLDGEPNNTVLCILTLRRLCRFLLNRFTMTEEEEEVTIPVQTESNIPPPSAMSSSVPQAVGALQTRNIPDFLQITVEELGVGTFKNLYTVTYDTPLTEALQLLAKHRVSGLPVVDNDGRAVDLYSRSDVRYLADANRFDLNKLTVKESLNPQPKRQVPKCVLSDTVDTMLRRLINQARHRIVVEDDEGKLLGIISLSDIFKFFVSEAV